MNSTSAPATAAEQAQLTSSPDGIQAVIVLTDPACVYAIDVVDEGVTLEIDVAARVAKRLGLPESQALAVVDGLVGVGFIARTGLGTVESLDPVHYRERVGEAMRQILWLREVGDEQQADDIVSAMDAAYNKRSIDADKRWSSTLFRESAAGRRHAARLSDRSIGHPGRTDLGDDLEALRVATA